MVGRWAGHGGGLCFQWEGAQVDIRLAHRLPGEVSRGAYLMAPLINCHVGLGGGSGSDLKIRNNHSLGLAQVCKKVSREQI